jgi:hypothetical protein
MSDVNGNAAAGSTLPGGNAGGGQSQPGAGGGGNADMMSIPRSEYDKLSRYGEQVKGFQPFVEKFKNYGIQRPEDFDKLDPYYKSMQELEKRGVKPDALSRIYSQEADDELANGRGSEQNLDPKKLREELMGEMRKEMATNEWKSLSAKEKDYVDMALRDVLGDEQVDEMSKSVYRRAVSNYLEEIREMYPEGHPLRDTHLQPLSENHAKKAVEYFKAERTKYAGSASAAKADAVIAAEKKGVSSSAGRTGGGGGPKNNGKQRPEDKEADQITKAHQAIQAKRAAGR